MENSSPNGKASGQATSEKFVVFRGTSREHLERSCEANEELRFSENDPDGTGDGGCSKSYQRLNVLMATLEPSGYLDTPPVFQPSAVRTSGARSVSTRLAVRRDA